MLCKNVKYLVLCMYSFMILFIDSPFKVRHNGTVISPYIHLYNIGFLKHIFAKLVLKDHLSITTTRSHDHRWSLYTSSTVLFFEKKNYTRQKNNNSARFRPRQTRNVIEVLTFFCALYLSSSPHSMPP